ncbi:MAG: NFACT RNA binding domain-containing protein [Caldilineaceae bacterium]
MHFDALTLCCMCAELKERVCPGRVQQVLLVSAHSFGLELYAYGARHYLLLSLETERNGIYLAAEKLRRGSDEQPPLLQLLRKYVRDALLTEIVQPDPYERVVRFHFQHPEHGVTVLLAEPMGRLSNLFLLNSEERILDCLYRVPPGERNQRVLLPGHLYTVPPSQNKVPPLDDGSGDYYERLAHSLMGEERLWKALVAHVAGISPTLGREISWRATNNVEAQTKDIALLELVSALQTLWSPCQEGGWLPGVWQEAGKIVGFSAFAAHLRGEFVPTATLSEAVEHFFAAEGEQPRLDAYAGQRQQVAMAIQAAHRRLQRQLTALAGDEPAPGEAEQVRSQAEWLLAYSSQIEADQKVLVVDLGEETLEIALDPQKSPVEQAQQLFKRAARMERASQIIPRRRSELLRDLEYLEQLTVDLTLASNQPEIAIVRSELETLGLSKESNKRLQPKQASAKPSQTGKPLSLRSLSGILILIGRNARQNEEVTFNLSHPRDLWLHVRSVPGSHVIIRSSGAPVDDETLQLAAQAAAYHSKLRGEKLAEVIVCERRFVQHAPGGRTGQVTVRNERIINVPATLPDEMKPK